MAKQSTKTADVKIRFHGHDWNNIFQMRSPTGTICTCHCNGKWDKMSSNLKELIHYMQYETDTRWGSWEAKTVTYNIMKELLKLEG